MVRAARLGRRHESPRVPCDLEDHEGDEEADERIAAGQAERGEDRARDDSDGDEPVRPRVVAVGDESRAREAPAGAKPDPGGELVPCEPDHPGSGESPEMRQILRLDEPLDGLVEGDAGRSEDREDDGETGDLLRTEAAQEERDSERHRGQSVAEVVHEVCEERDGARQREDPELRDGGQPEDREAERDCPDARSRPDDRAIDEPVGMPVLGRAQVVAGRVLARVVRSAGLRPPEPEREVAMGACMRMGMNPAAVSMRGRCVRHCDGAYCHCSGAGRAPRLGCGRVGAAAAEAVTWRSVRFVVDCSAVLHLAGEEIEVAAAHELLAPTLLRSQTLSALHEAVHAGEMPREVALDRLARIRAMPIRLLGDAVLRRRAWDLAEQLGWAETYDAEYLALTQLQADAFVTLDAELARRAQDVVPTASIETLLTT